MSKAWYLFVSTGLNSKWLHCWCIRGDKKKECGAVRKSEKQCLLLCEWWFEYEMRRVGGDYLILSTFSKATFCVALDEIQLSDSLPPTTTSLALFLARAVASRAKNHHRQFQGVVVVMMMMMPPSGTSRTTSASEAQSAPTIARNAFALVNE